MSILDGAGFVADAIGNVSSYLMNEQSAETSRKWQAEQNRLQQNWQTSENQRSREWEEKMWNMSNAYNTPSAQRARLREAGFSPWQSGGGGAGVAPNLASSHGSPSAGSPSMVGSQSFPVIQNPFEHAMQDFAFGSEIDNQQIDKLDKIVRGFAQARQVLGDERAKNIYLPLLREIAGSRVSADLLYRKATSDAEFVEAQASLKRVEEYMISTYGENKANKEITLLNANIQKVGEEAKKLRSEAGKLDSEADLNYAKIDEVASAIARNFAAAAYDSNQAALLGLTMQALVDKAYAEAGIAQADLIMAEGEVGATGKLRSWRSSDLGQTIEAVNHYVNMICENVGKVAKVHIGFNSNTGKITSVGRHFVNGRYSSTSESRNINQNWTTSRRANNMVDHNPKW